MISLTLKNKINYKFSGIITLFIFSAFLNTALASIAVNDDVVRENTGTIVTNSQNIAAILAGSQPGAQYDSLQTQHKMLPEVKTLLRKVTENEVKWVNTGFDGGPAYITNTGRYLQTQEDGVINTFVTENPALDSACKTFQTPIKQAIGLQYQTFEKRIQCSLDSNQSGFSWDSWLQMTTIPQNNVLGAMVIAQDELDNRIETAQNQATLEANWGNGFMSWKTCDRSRANYDRGYDGCEIKTPGEIIAEKLNQIETSNFRQIETANDFNNIAFVLSQQSYYSNPGAFSTQGLNPPPTTTNVNQIRDQYSAYLNDLSNSGTAYTPESAQALTENQTRIETSYYNSQNEVLNLLNNAEATFSTSVSCPANIKKMIIDQINKTVAYDQTNINNLFWNKKDVNDAIMTVINNVNILNSARAALAQNPQDPTTLSLIESLNNIKTLYTNMDVNDFSKNGEAFNKIKNWLINMLIACNMPTTGTLTQWGI